jgi:hypothetical protein
MNALISEGLTASHGGGDYGLTSNGFKEMERLQRGRSNSAQAFVAMWFDAEVDGAHRDGIEVAVRRSGYEPMRIDKKEHNNKIDDEIIAEIKKSRFIIADFTSGRIKGADGTDHWLPRGGVYFEAGFAYGLGIPVIWTCREADIAGVHFDTRQFAHILWTTPQELAERLYNRIIHVVGQGPRPAA